MSPQYFIWPAIILTILVGWLTVGYKINQKNPSKGFLFLCIYVLLSTHFCMAVSEDKWAIPRAEVKTLKDFLQTHKNQSFEFHIVELANEQFIRVRPHSDSHVLYLGYNLYRNLLLNSWIPEYIFDSKGNLTDWTTDNHDDGRYQDKWDYAKEIRKTNSAELTDII